MPARGFFKKERLGLLKMGRDWLAGLWPPQRNYAAPWSMAEIIAVWFVGYQLIPSLFALLCRDLVLFLGLAEKSDKAADMMAADMIPYIMAGHVLGLLPALYLCLRFLNQISATEPYQVGLRGDRLDADSKLAILAWLIVSAPVLMIQALMVVIFQPEAHPFQKAIAANPTIWIYIGLIGTAVIAAPVFEEFVFRGLLLKWCVLRPWGCDLCLAASFAFALFIRSEKLGAVARAGLSGSPALYVEALAPAAFILLMIPGYIYSEFLAWRWLPTPNAARAVYAQGLLFAIVHAGVWPSPIALFPLGLALGFLAYRTQSLIGPIVFHGLFNLIGCITLLLPGPDAAQAEKGKAETAAFNRPAAVSTATAVPGSSEPRRR